MKIRVKIPRTNKIKEVDLEKGAIIKDLLEKINFKPDTVIIMDNNKPLPITDVLIDSQELTILQVSSGG